MEKKEYRLSIDPRILELLGPSLYTNIYYILAELIANAYDAEAHNVYIISNKDDITVEDDGKGMSYQNGDIKKYLSVAEVSRNNNEDSTTKTLKRKKMGRKGVGKLAALSVSENVLIKTISNGEKSGFILSRYINDDNLLTPISDENITFNRITNSGTAVVMQNPQYKLHSTLKAIKRNLLKIFPLVSEDFQIHLIRGTEEETIKDFDKEMSFIINSIKDNWMKKNATIYNKSHTLVTYGTFSVHNYNTLQENEANYQRYLDHVYTIGGINFKNYMTEDINCYNQKVVEAQRLIEQNAPRNKVDELLSGQKSKKTVLDENYTPETYTTYKGKPLYVKWSKTKRVSDILTAEIYDFSGNSLKQYRDYLEIKQASNKNKKSILKFDKRTQQRASMAKKKINIANNTYVITPDML